jgi:hypothetical protein
MNTSGDKQGHKCASHAALQFQHIFYTLEFWIHISVQLHFITLQKFITFVSLVSIISMVTIITATPTITRANFLWLLLLTMVIAFQKWCSHLTSSCSHQTAITNCRKLKTIDM